MSIRVKLETGNKSVNIKWLPNCGVRKTLVAEKHFRYVAKANPGLVLKENTIRFRPYSTDKEVPIIGKCKAVLSNEAGGDHVTTIYVVDGGEESLLGKEDAQALGIIHLSKRGSNNKTGETGAQQQQEEGVGRITPR